MAIRLGDEAPNFTADTTMGPVNFHEWKKGSWAVLFSHPADFTPVCTTELGRLAALKPEFDRRNCKLIGLSVDSVESHKRWENDIADVTGHTVNFPIIGDSDRAVSTMYDMIHPNVSDSQTVRSVFVVGPDNKVKLTITYPASTGRNCDEILRIVDSVQLTSDYSVSTPVDWKPGDEVIIATSITDDDAKKKFPKGFVAKKPYFRVTPQPNL